MTANITWTPCGSSSDGQYLYYGQTLVATGTPLSGTGWTLYTGLPLGNTLNAASIAGLSDNVQYTFYIYCHCPSSGAGPLTNQGPIIKYVCPTVTNITPIYNAINYTLSVPSSANNPGTWIQTIVVKLLDSTGTVTLYTNTSTSPFASTISGGFTNLMASTNYTLQVSYSNNSMTQSNVCTTQTVTTLVTCAAPTVTVTNITNTSFDVNYTPINSGDTFSILINGNTVATGLTVSPYTVTSLVANTSYTVSVIRNCVTGGTGSSSPINATTTNTSTCTTEVSSLGMVGITTSSMGITWVNPSNSTGNSIQYRPCGTTTWLTFNAAGNYSGSYTTGGSGPGNVTFVVIGVPSGTCLEFLVQNSCGTPTSYSTGLIVSGTTLFGLIAGNITLTSSGGTQVELTFGFSQPTPVGGLTLYFGSTYLSGFTVRTSNGYDLLGAIPPGSVPDPSLLRPNLPWVCPVPANVTSFSIISSLTVLVQTTPDGGQSWRFYPTLESFTDLFVHVQAPAGYGANFSITNPGIVLHNV